MLNKVWLLLHNRLRIRSFESCPTQKPIAIGYWKICATFIFQSTIESVESVSSEVSVSTMRIVCTFRKRLMRLQVKMAKIKSDRLESVARKYNVLLCRFSTSESLRAKH